MLNTKALQKSLSTELETILAGDITKAIVAEQGAPRPQNPYVAFKMLGMVQLGSATITTNADDDRLFDLKADHEVLITFTAYGATSKDIVSKLMFHMQNNAIVQDRLLQIGLAPKGVPKLIDQSLLLETKFEQRSKVDIEFFMTICETVDYGTIETVNLDSCYISDVNGSPAHENSINIPNS